MGAVVPEILVAAVGRLEEFGFPADVVTAWSVRHWTRVG